MLKKRLLIIYPKKLGGEYLATKKISHEIIKLSKEYKLLVKEIEINNSIFIEKGKFRLFKLIILNLLIFFRILKKISSSQAKKINYIYSSSASILFLVFLFPKFRKAKVIYHFHGFEFGEDDKNLWQYSKKEKMNFFVRYFYFIPLIGFYFLLLKFILKKSWKIFVPSHYSSSVIFKKFPTIDRNKFVILPNGYDPKIFYPSNKNLSSATYKILFVGRLTKEKGIKELLKAFEFLNKKFYFLNLVCCSVGNLEFETEIKKIIRTKKNINFLFNLSPNQIADYYRKSDLTVLPSNIYFEQLPLVYLESLACGTPVLVSKKIPGILFFQKQISLPNLILYKITPKEIASKIENFVRLPINEKKKIRKKCLEIVKTFTWENSAKIFMNRILD